MGDEICALFVTLAKSRTAWISAVSVHCNSLNVPLIIVKSDMAMQKKREEIINKWIANKSGKAYIKVDEDFRDCDFMFEWNFAE